ncbi:MAG: fused MFS/spermidine synthase [Myxococcota bacterium]
MDPRFPLVLLCFFLSGFAALLYETAWTREFAFVFGTSELAVISVLAAYMGGLAAGAAIAARVAPRMRRPILVYGVLELGIAVLALAVPLAIAATTGLYVSLFGGLPAPPDEAQLAGVLFHLGGSFLILMAPTALMGATLPLLARYAVRRDEQIGRRIGLLYAANTAGAIGGTLAAAFALLPAVGLRQTVYCGAGVNVLVFGLALLLTRGAPPLPVVPGAARPASLASRWILPLLLLSGFASFTYEVLWTRLLSHILGGSVFAFATMLASFLLGITLGAALASRLATRARPAAIGFGCAQIATAALSVAAFRAVDGLPALAAILGAGGRGSLGANALFAGAVLMPPAIAIGTTLPFAVRLLATSERDAAPAIARAYAWNTAGSIAGAIAGGFWLLPTLGYAGTLTTAAGLNLALAAAAATLLRPSVRVLAAVATACVAALALLSPQPPWALLRASPMRSGSTSGAVAYYGVGRSATVLALERPGGWSITTNGLPEATVARPGETPIGGVEARWLTLLPGLLRPQARSLLLIGLGGAVALESVPRSFDSVDVIELEPEVVEANRVLGADRGRDPLADPRVRVHVNDARGSLLLTDMRFDAIVSQPSHPWTAGASHLYTREFFELARSRLTPNGVFVQWIGLRFLDEPLLRSLLATLCDVYPEVEIYQPVPVALLFVASNDADHGVQEIGRMLADDPEAYARSGIRTPEDLIAARVLDGDGARALSRGAPFNTDDRNQLAMSSGRLLAGGLRPAASQALFAPFDPLLRPADVDRVELVRSLGARGEWRRALGAAEASPDAAARETAIGWVELERGKPRAARRRFARVLARAPSDPRARFGLVRARRSDLVSGDPEVVALTTQLPPAQGAVAQGWFAAARDDWEGVRALEAVLASAGPGDLAYEDATRLRARWRVAIGDRVAAIDAIDLVDGILLPAQSSHDLLLRARAGRAAGRPDVTASSLERIAGMARRTGRTTPGVLHDAAELAAALPASDRAAALRASFEPRR